MSTPNKARCGAKQSNPAGALFFTRVRNLYATRLWTNLFVNLILTGQNYFVF
jgi:hypothetical protein